MDDTWFTKLLLPTLDVIPPPVLISVLNSWYESRSVIRRKLVKSMLINEYAADLLRFLKCYAIHAIIAGEKAAVTVNQKDYAKNMNVFIPVYGNLDAYFVPTLQSMLSKARADSTLMSSHGIKELVEFSHNVISKQTGEFCTEQKNEKKQARRRSIQVTIDPIDVIWIEVPIDPSSPFTKQVAPHTLFIFYLLAGCFDIVTSRVAILNWEDEAIIEGGFYRILHATEMLDLIYRLPGYEFLMLKPMFDSYKRTYRKLYEDIQRRSPHYSEKKYLNVINVYTRLIRYSSYFYAGAYRVEKYPKYRALSLTQLCFNILVSLSDLFWVKHKQNFPHTNYALFTKTRDEMLVKIHRKKSL